MALVLLTMLAAAGGGVLFAWQQHLYQGPLPHGEAIAPADASVKENLSLPSKYEQKMRDTVEEYLNPKGKQVDHATGGFGLCADLGLYYLENHRLDDADRLFTRLEGKDQRFYKMLGQLGKGIVLALRDEPKESSDRFKGVFSHLVIKGIGGPKDNFTRKLEKEAPQFKGLLDNPHWRYWLARARWYNNRNGLAERDVPLWMLRWFSGRDGQPKPPGKKDKAG